MTSLPNDYAQRGVPTILSPPWSWCSRCHRAYLTGAARLVSFDSDVLHPGPLSITLCAYLDCAGPARRIEWPWAIYRGWHPDAPIIPEYGKVYSA